MERLIAVALMLVAASGAMADALPSMQKISDCMAFVQYVNFLARARHDNYFPPAKLSEKYLKEQYGNSHSMLRESFRFASKDKEKEIDKIENLAISMVVHADKEKLNQYVDGTDSFAICREYADEIVLWKPISQ